MPRKRTATYKLETDEKGAIRGLKAVSRQSGTTGQAFGKLGKTAKLALGGVAAGSVAALGAELAKRGVQIESIMSRAETVFGSGADAAKKWADENNEAFGTSEASLLNMANGLQDLLVPLGIARAEAQEMTTDSLNVANALSEWTGGAKSATDAADAIGKAILGERERLKEFGVKLSEADIKTRLAALGMDKLTGAALDQAKAQISLELIMEKSADAIDAYNTSGNEALRDQKELAAQIADVKDQAAEMAATVGAAVIPVLSDFFDLFSAENADRVEDVLAHLREFGEIKAADIPQFVSQEDINDLAEVGITLADIEKHLGDSEEDWDSWRESVGAASNNLNIFGKSDAAEAQTALRRIREALLEANEELLDAAIKTDTLGNRARFAGGEMTFFAGEVTEGAVAVDDLASAQRAAGDPMAAAIRAADKYTDAQGRVNDLAADGKKGSEEYEDALLDLIGAHADYEGAVTELAENPASREAFLKNAEDAGVLRAEAQGLVGDLKLVRTELETINNMPPVRFTILADGSGTDIISEIIRAGNRGNIIT